jgi:hypothetical protein
MEPQDVTTVSRKALVHFGDDDAKVYAKAAATYRANLIRRFGRIPSWPELAKREDRAVAKIRPHNPQGQQEPHPNTVAAMQVVLAKGEATRASILSVMTKPMTCPDIAMAIKRSPQLIRRHLGLLVVEGKVTGRNVKGVTVWERRQEAAE